jgi:hypothetical protein
MRLVTGYTPLAAAQSRRRAQTEKEAKRMIGSDLSERDLTIVTFSRSGVEVNQEPAAD